MKIALPLIATLFCSIAHAQLWLPLGESDELAMSIDFKSIRPQGPYTKAWVRYSYKTPQTVNGFPSFTFQSILTLSYFDCKSGAFGNKQGNYYADQDARGKIVNSFSKAEGQIAFEDPIPGSVGRALLDYACIKR